MGTFPICQGRRSKVSNKPLTDCILCDRRWPISRDGDEWLYPLPDLVDGHCAMRVAFAVVAPGRVSDGSPPSGSALPVLPPVPSGAGGVFLS